MAYAGPVGKDNLNISFRLQNKAQVFNATSNVLMNAKVNLCAVSSSLGLVFVGSNNPEIIVLCIKDIEAGNENPPLRRIPLPSPVTQIGINCDGSILAIDLSLNGTPHIQLYSVPSFLSPNIQKLREFRVSTDNACSIQICWNPVINTTLAVCTASGGLNLYSLKDTGVEFHSIDPSLQAKCCCWSPKGKQIVAGFANGKLIQFNMELKSARVIECPPGIFSTNNFETIAVQWLSTYQFAMALSSQQEEIRPVIYILNAPKAGPQQYIAYNDICYSTSEVRPSRIYLQYIQQWGMILIASANCVDVSFLKISKPGDIPEWTQEFPNDQFLAELPLTPEREESFPIGFEIDIACQGRLLQEEGKYPVMPMLHMLSTNGVLCSFYVLNTTSSYVDICSPPRPIDPRILAQFFKTSTLPAATVTAVKKDDDTVKTPAQVNPPPFSHSTPSNVKTNLFGSMPATSTPAVQPQPSQNTFTGFSLPNNQASSQQAIPAPVQSTFQFTSKPTVAVTLQESSTAQKQPLISVPPTFNPSQNQTRPSESAEKPKDSSVDIEDERVYIKMIQDEMKAFELEFNFLMEKSKSMKVRIGTKEESAEMRRGLEELDALKKEAMETIEFLRSDIQTHRLGLTEMFAMLYEAKAKCNQDNKSMMMNNKGQDRSIKRKLENLHKMVSLCDMQIQVVVQLLQSQWSNYQDALTKKNKNRMHIPSLEGVYQTLTKQQEIIYRLSGKLKLFKSKLGICDDVKKQKNININSAIESLSDSIISISLVDQVQAERSKISEKKLIDLRKSLLGREVVEIRPQRPKLIGLNSEIIIEKRANALKSLKKKVEVPKPQQFAPPKSEVSRPVNPPQTSQNFHKIPSEPNFNTAQRTLFAAPAQVSQQPIQLTTKKSEEAKPFSFASQPAASQPSFNLNTSGSQPSFGLNTSSSQPQQSFGLNTSNTPPSFSISSTPLILNAEKDKKKEEPIKVAPQTQKTEPKPPSNTPAAVSANFSLSIPPNKTPPKEVSVQDTKSQPITSNETTSFTFSLPGKKETPAKPIFAAPQSSSDSAKGAFSFGSSNPSESTFSFGNLATKSEVKPAITTSASTFGSTPVTTSSGSIFSGSGFSLTSDSNKPSSTTTANIFASKSEETKTAVTTTSQPSIFSSTAADSKPSSTFSFASFGSSIAAPSTQANVTSTTNSSIFGTKTESPISQISQTKPADSIKSLLTGVNICSPDVAQKTDSTAPANIFGSSTFSISKSNTSAQSPFGSSSFGSALKSPAEVSSTAVTSISSSPVTTTSTATPSIFGNSPTQPSSGSLFGSLSLGGTNTDQPSTNIFGAKPEQSVFGVSSTSNVFGASPSNIFASANATQQPPSSPSTNIFGASTTATQSTNIFGQSSSISNQASAAPSSTTSNGSIFSQSNSAFPATTQSASIFGQSSSIFGQSANTPAAAASGTSIFSQNASPFGAPASPVQSSSNIFGGNSASPFSGSTGGSIFSGSAAGTGQATFGGSATFSTGFGAGGSIFGQQQAQPTFGGGATFGSPKSNIFNSPPQSPSSGNIFEQLGQQQSGNLFGNLAANPQQQQQQAPPQLQGSAFSSWR